LRLAAQSRQLAIKNAPDDPMIHLGIAVNEDVPKSDDALMLADPRGRSWIDPGQLPATNSMAKAAARAMS
jgi:hypothetical protein